MSNLLRELASGPAALPRNSEIVLFNALTGAQQQQRLADCSRVGSAIGIRHVQGNPLNRSDMAHKIDISECDTALSFFVMLLHAMTTFNRRPLLFSCTATALKKWATTAAALRPPKSTEAVKRIAGTTVRSCSQSRSGWIRYALRRKLTRLSGLTVHASHRARCPTSN